MSNIINCVLAQLLLFCGGLLLNKGIIHSNFTLLLFLLTLWLLTFTLIINRCEKGTLIHLNIFLICRVLLVFKTKNLLLFFIYFELSVLPITLIVFLYGYQPEKLQAAFSLLLYTVVGSLPLFLFIITSESTMIQSAIIAFSFTFRFIVKTPMYIVHTWLPKAHVEAPVGGSIMLAGVLLKLGSYGLLVFLPNVKLNILLISYFSISLVGSIVCSLICLRQGDLKLLVAYSSVVHMGVVTLGFISGRVLGYTCGVIMIIAHGLCSPFLFSFAYWLYSNSHSRLMVNNNRNWPLILLSLFTLVRQNIGVPPRLSVWSEVLITISSINLYGCIIPWLIGVFFLGGAYNLYLYVSCIHTKGIENSRSIYVSWIIPIIQVSFLGYGSFICLDLFHILFYITN